MDKILYGFIISLLFFNWSFSQQGIAGVVKAEKDSTAVSNAYIVLSNLSEHKVLAYTVSDKNGKFDLNETLSKGVYRIKVHHQQYNAWQKDIVIDSILKKTVKLNIYLSERNNALDEVVIKVEKPVVVKKDTIIYNIKHFTNNNDDDLESVLKRLDGFEISKDGEIKVKDKTIQKVLINGKEVSNNGAALITKSIDPKKISKIEVRFKEKDNRIKESLLSSSDYAVLDIKLKKEYPFFGKISLNQAWQKQYLPGAYANMFSLKKKLKFHFFGEYNPLGNPVIKLLNIKNMGKEALAKLFARPVDYDDIIHKQGFEDEIYGFKDYKLHRNAIVGITANYTFNKNWQCFIGSFNAYNRVVSEVTTSQFNWQSPPVIYRLSQPHKNLSSKNKIEIRYDNQVTKMRFDVNFVTEQNDKQQNLNFENQSYDNSHQYKNSQTSWYHNFLLERKINERWGVDIKMNYSHLNNLSNVYLQQNDSLTGIVLSGQSQNPVYDFEQEDVNGFNDFFAGGALHFLNDKYEIVNRIIYSKRQFNFSQTGRDTSGNTDIDAFTQAPTLYQYQDIRNKISFSRFSNAINFYANITLAKILKSTAVQTVNSGFFVNYKASLSYTPSNYTDISLSYDNHLTDISLLKQIYVKKITDYNLIRLPGVYPMTREQLVEFSWHKNWDIFDMEFAVLNGHSVNKYELVPTQTLFTYQKAGVSKTMYNMISIQLTKNIKHTKIILEPEHIYHLTHNQAGQQENVSESNVYLLGLKWFYQPAKKRWNYRIYPKYTFFVYKNSLANDERQQQMFSFDTNLSYRLPKQNLKAGSSFRYVFFDGLSYGNYYNFGLFLKGIFHKIHWKIEASNLTDQQYFYTQMDMPLFLYKTRHQIFGRYFSLSLQYMF